MEEVNNKLIVICGATATGKSGLAVSVAKQIDAEVISADSMQIYNGLNIGTAKVTEAEMQGVPHYMLDIIEPYENFSVADYVARARPIVDDILNRGKRVIICGGTGLYIDALCDGRVFSKGKESPETLYRLQGTDTETLYRMLQNIDAVSADKIHPNNRKRLIRALYVSEIEGKPFSVVGEQAMPSEKPYNRLVLHCHYQDRQHLYDAIEKRVDIMLNIGLISEAEYVFNNRERFKTAAAAIGYKELFDFIEGKGDYQDCVARLKQATRNYAKRQLSWFNRYNDANNVEVFRQDTLHGIVLPLLEEFYN